MMSHMAAIKAALDVAPFAGKVWVLENTAQTPLMPYLLIEPGVGSPVVEASLAFEDGDLDQVFRIKAVGTNMTSTGIALRHARTRLVNGGRKGRLLVPGRSVELEYVRHEADYLDSLVLQTTTQVTLSVDTYRLVSTPA